MTAASPGVPAPPPPDRAADARPRPRPPILLLLNGPPGVGKSTLAAALAARHPTLRALDVDAVKHRLDLWPEDPGAAGLRAREIVLDQARAHLGAGTGVVIGQYLARADFADALAGLAAELRVPAHEVVLDVPAPLLADRLRARRAAPTRPEQPINDALTDPDAAEELRDSVRRMAAVRPHVLTVDASGDVGATVALLERATGLA